MDRFKLSTRDIAFVAIFAALSVIICKTIPGIPIVGVSGAKIKFDVALAPIYGLIIGPYLGFLAALIGGLIAAGDWFSVLTSFCTAVSALVAGFLTCDNCRVRGRSFQGWMFSAVVLGMLIFGWYLTPIGQRAPFYPILHFSGLLAILFTRNWTAKSFKNIDISGERGFQTNPSYMLYGILTVVSAYFFSKPYLSEIALFPYLTLPLYFVGGVLFLYGVFGGGRRKFVSAVFLASYCGIIADHMLGNIIFISAINVLIPFSVIEEYFLKPLNLPDVPSLFMYMIPISTVERVLFTAIATFFGVGLILALHRAGLLERKT